MLLGCAVPISGSWATPDACAEIAELAEELGYRSLWTFQRLLAPLDSDGRHRLGPQYRRVHDPLAILAYLSATTESPRLGLAVVDAPFYSPIVLAKSLTTIDHLCDGRLDVGLGLGWMKEEFEAAGVPLEHRGARTEDFVRCLRAVWTEDVVDYEGPYFHVPRCAVEPKPVQLPHPPVLFGGTADAALRRAGALGDGWISGSRADPESFAPSIKIVRDAATAAGRDRDALRFVCRAVVKERTSERAFLTGSLQEIRDDLSLLGRAGMTEAFVDLNFDTQIASPEAKPAQSMRHARHVLEALAPD